ncbi:MAG: hypothetical protein EXR92_02245 [Gemmatimonadetes bacterium]|nr:hypothetical protein [Gemmatimonadota bacterium]
MAALLLVAAGLVAPPSALAQTSTGGRPEFLMHSGVGYTMVVPGALAGVGAFHVFQGIGWGIYPDTHFNPNSLKGNRDFLKGETLASVESLDQEQVGRMQVVEEEDEWLVLNLHVLKVLTPELAVGLGAGAARKSHIVGYIDHSADINLNLNPPYGFLYVEDEAASGWEVNATVNALVLGGGRFAFMVGYELAPRSFSVGLFLTFRNALPEPALL